MNVSLIVEFHHVLLTVLGALPTDVREELALAFIHNRSSLTSADDRQVWKR